MIKRRPWKVVFTDHANRTRTSSYESRDAREDAMAARLARELGYRKADLRYVPHKENG